VTSPAAGSMQLNSFKLELTDVAKVDLEKLHALSISVGWPHRAEDWQFLLETGQGIAALDGIGRVLGSAMWFPYGDDFATIGMVITTPRLQARGAGQWFMEHLFSKVGDRSLGLSATNAARRLYLSLNFQPEAIVYQYQGEAIEPPAVPLPASTTLRPLGPGDLEEIAALDEVAFGTDRSALLARLTARSKGVVLVRDGQIAAFSLCRRFGRGHVVGPVVAADDADAIAVVRPHVARHAGSFLRLDTREKKGDFADFLGGCGLSVFDTVTSMSLGRTWPPARPDDGSAPRTYGLASHTLG
jgi:GNAT superfamily N-acetyltransferase